MIIIYIYGDMYERVLCIQVGWQLTMYINNRISLPYEDTVSFVENVIFIISIVYLVTSTKI